MTISAPDGSGDEDNLSRAIELYRDYGLTLRARLAALRAQQPADADLKGLGDDMRSHRKAMQTAIEIEASLGKQRRSWLGGGTVELDLAGARAEILARLGDGPAEG